MDMTEKWLVDEYDKMLERAVDGEVSEEQAYHVMMLALLAKINDSLMKLNQTIMLGLK